MSKKKKRKGIEKYCVKREQGGGWGACPDVFM